MIGDSIQQTLAFLKKKYLVKCGTDGGSAAGFAKFCTDELGDDPRLLAEALAALFSRAWRVPPRKRGPDLFSINKLAVPEYITRSTKPVLGEDIEADEAGEDVFQQVDHESATVGDSKSYADIKMRKAMQAAAAANETAKQSDEAFRRSNGQLDMFLKDIADGKR